MSRRARAVAIGLVVALFVAAASADYVVKRGDTLGGIALQRGTTVGALVKANHLKDPNLIHVGQHLVIPGESGAATSEHVVTGGETLGLIAARFGTTVAAIVAANHLRDPNRLLVGQRLVIPGGASTPGTDTGSATPGAGTTPAVHIVAPGETLSSIARTYGTSVTAIARVNGITDPSLIYAGATLQLTGKATVVAEGAKTSASHTVRRGETLSSIAARYATTVAALADANHLSNPNHIRIGQVLSVPDTSWVCPVPGAHYINDWGFPRAGHVHQGNDLFAPSGTPVRAPVPGVVTFTVGTIGGRQFKLTADDGTVYYGTHLSAFGQAGRVNAGTVVGYVGNTGDAAGGPYHLHFEIHPMGGPATNPFPTLQAHGC